MLLTLQYYVTDGSYASVGDFSGVYKTTVGRIVNSVTSAIASLQPTFVKLTVTREEIKNTQVKFHDIAAFPRVIGALDCTHIRIKYLGGDTAEQYRNRKGMWYLKL